MWTAYFIILGMRWSLRVGKTSSSFCQRQTLFELLLKEVALGLGMQLSLAHVPVHSKDVQIIVARLGSFQAKWEVLGR